MFSFVRKWFGGKAFNSGHGGKRSAKHRRRTFFESLEPRLAMTTFVVDSLRDENDGDFGARDFTLREALTLANAQAGSDAIVFSPDLGRGTIRLNANFGELRVADSVSITGPVTLDGANQSRVLNIGNAAGSINVSLSGLTVRNGFAEGGAGVLTQNTTLTIRSGEFINNFSGRIENGGAVVAGGGGALAVSSGTVTVADSNFLGNTAGVGGAVGVFLGNGSVSLNRCALKSNSATTGGAIFNFATVNVVSSLIQSNGANAGAAVSTAFGSLGIYNSTLARNFGNDTVIVNSGLVTIVNSTLAENMMASSSGTSLKNTGGTALLQNSIVIGTKLNSFPADDVAGTLLPSSSHNLIGVGPLTNGVSGNVVGATFEQELFPLRSNGGKSLTYAPTPWSRAIDSGLNSLAVGSTNQPLTLDQRSGQFSRLIDGDLDGTAVVDIGAVETKAFADPLIVRSLEDDILRSDAFAANSLTLREAIAIANARAGKDVVTFDDTLFADGEGLLTLIDQFQIDDDLVIAGPVGGELSLDGSGAVRHFSVGINHELEIADLSLINGLAGQGGSILNAGRHLVLRNVVAANNYASDQVPNETGVSPEGGVIHNVRTIRNANGLEIDLDVDQNVELIGSRFVANKSDNFGGVVRMFLGDSLSIVGCIFSSNSGGNGGVTAAGGGQIRVFDSLFVDNVSDSFGGALRSFGDTLVVRSSFIHNSAKADEGGAIGVDGQEGRLTVINSSFFDNHSSKGASAVRGGSSPTAPAVIRNSTIFNNLSDDPEGGAVGPGQLEVGGKITIGTLQLFNSIVASNTAAGMLRDIVGPVDAAASLNNIISQANSAGGLMHNVNGNKVGVDPLLGPIVFENGRYFAKPQPSSPAIDAGVNTRALDENGVPLTVDQRGSGFRRFIGAAVDIGAIEADRPNVAPALNIGGGTAAYVEGAAPVIIAPAATVVDADSANFAGGRLTVSITGGGQSDDRLTIKITGDGAGQFNVSGSVLKFGGLVIGSITGGQGTSPLVVTFNGAATLAIVQSTLRSITYQTVGDNPSSQPRAIQFELEDGDGGKSNSVQTGVSVTPINNAPVLTLSGSVGYKLNGAAIALVPNAGVRDPDNANFSGGRLTVHIGSGANSSNRLLFSSGVEIAGTDVRVGGIKIGSLNVGGGVGTTDLVVTFNGNATSAAVQSLMRAINFRTVSGTSTASRVVSFTLTDGKGGVSNTAVKTVAVSL